MSEPGAQPSVCRSASEQSRHGFGQAALAHLYTQGKYSSQAWLRSQHGLVAIPSEQFGCGHHILESLIILIWVLPFPLVSVLQNSARASYENNRDVTRMDIWYTVNRQVCVCMCVCTLLQNTSSEGK